MQQQTSCFPACRVACRWFYALLAALIVVAVPAGAARAADGAKESADQAVAQSDGICSRVTDELWQNTDRYWHKGDYNRDIALIRVVVSIDPSFTEAYSTGAWLIWSMGDSSAADSFLQDGLRNSPDRAGLEYEFGWQLFNTKRYVPAVAYLKRSVADGSTDRRTYAMLAHAYRLLGKYDASIAVWKKTIAKFPDYVAAPANLARVEALKKSGIKPAALTPQ